MKSSSTKVPNGHGSLYKEVRFSPTATPIPIRRALSVPNTHLVSNSDPLHSRPAGPEARDSSALATSYLEQSRSLLERQRAGFDHERTLFDEERRLWEKEQTLLNLRIAELESLLRSTAAAGRTAPTGATTSLSTFAVQPSMAPSDHSQSQVWEGSSPSSAPTRVFSDPEKPSQALSITEQGSTLTVCASSLDAALSPKSHPADAAGNSVPVPIEKLDSRLDGITLKSSALPPDIIARVMTPPSPQSPDNVSPSSTASQKASERRHSLKLKLSELGPPEKNLTRDAGHTPMAVVDQDVDTGPPSRHEKPNLNLTLDGKGEGEGEVPSLVPEARLRQPAENSDSYFGNLPDLPDDPALKGPLSLLNEKEHDTGFLKELDLKLLSQARQVVGYPQQSDGPTEGELETPEPGGEPELKFKNTMNFGSAFGQSGYGKF